MKKKILSILAFILASLLLFSACNTGSIPSDDTTTADNVTTAEPEGTTKEPEETTKEPSNTTKEPSGVTTAEPDDNENKPAGGTTAGSITTQAPNTTTAPNGGTQNPTEPEDETYTAVESYLPSGTATLIKNIFENKRFESGKVVAYVKQDTMPYALADVKTVSNGKLMSITIPVIKTDAKDQNGDFIFTISVIGNSDAGLKGSVKRAYQIKINAEKYSLTENNTSVFKFIKVDVSDYNIVLTAEETLAFLAQEDTIYPAYLFASNNSIVEALNSTFPQATKYYNFGTSNETNGLKLSNNSLLYDFEFERTYDSKVDYDMANDYSAVLQKVKDIYGGKSFSIIGDSISTFKGISNNGTYNATIANNAALYGWGEVSDSSMTYWGRLITDTGMSLCVNNAWSGSHVVGTANSSYASGYLDNMYYRSTELDRDSGETPDVIFVFMGTNDLIHNSTIGELYTILKTNDGRSEKQKIDEWFAGVSTRAANSGNTLNPFSNWAEAYALSLNAMKNKYQGAELFCLTLMPNHHKGFTAQNLEKFNTCIKALGNYFGATVIELDKGEITYDNCAQYTVDGSGDAIHPNIKGFAYMEKTIIKAMYKKITSK